MGKCESATASIGIKILLSDLILQINETNLNLIMEIMQNGYIEDENDYFNEVYQEVIYDDIMGEGNYADITEYLMSELKNKGTLDKYKYHSKEEHTITRGRLFDKYLLVPVKKILGTDRWGYDRYGTNCRSRPMDFDLSIDIEKYKEIEKFEIVFLLVQNSG